MHTKLAHSLLLLCIVRLGCAAPAPVIDKRRESTPEILDLEQELKKQAGEDKKFYPNQHSMPIPQIDGLDDKPLEEQLGAADTISKNPELNAQLPIMEDPEEGEKDEEDVEDIEEPEEEAEEAGYDEEEEEEEDDEEEAGDEMLEGEDDRKAFMDGLIDSLQRHPELLSQMMRDGELDLGPDGDAAEEGEDNDLPVDDRDMSDAIQAEMMSAMRGDRTKDARPVPIEDEMADDVSQNTGATTGESENDLLEDELEDEGDDDDDEDEDEEYGNDEDEEEEEEAEDYYEDLLKEIANKRPELLRENMQVYRGDDGANVVAKKRGYAPPEGYDSMPGYGPLEDEFNEVGAEQELPLEAQNNIAAELDALKNYWASMQQQEDEEEEDVDRTAREADLVKRRFM